MTSFGRVLRLCGLDADEAVEFFDMPGEAVQGWLDGSREVPAAAWEMLAQLYGQIERTAARTEIMLEKAGLDPTLWNEAMGVPEGAERLPNGAEINAGLIASLRRLQVGKFGDGAISA